MSMLAERKRKQKWSLNPRGKEWSEDSNKFGQKLMEKMGWSQGKGLGAQLNGITEHVKVSFKNDSRGIGFKENTEQWTEHEDNFTALLKNLTTTNGTETKPEVEALKPRSLEEKSLKSKVRVHYHKFTRGKDLARYSEKDLANIFGKKTLKENTTPKKVIEQENGEEMHNFGVHTSNSGSMLDYFKKKLPTFNFGNNYVIGNNGVLQKSHDSESEHSNSFGFGFTGFKQTTVEENSIENSQLENKPKKRKKEHAEDSISKKTQLDKEETDSVKESKKKKKKREEIDIGLSNPAFNPLFNNIVVEKHILNTIEESYEDIDKSRESFNENKSIKKKKTKKRSIEDSELSIQEDCPSNYEVKRKRNKKKNKEDTATQEDSSNSKLENENKIEKKKKNRVNKNEENVFDNPSFNNANEDSSSNIAEESLPSFEVARKKNKKNKKKKLCEIEENGLNNPTFDTEDVCLSNFEVLRKEDRTEEFTSPIEKKKKKKKRKVEDTGIENPVFEEQSENFGNKRKKLREIEENGLDNPTFDTEDGCLSNFETLRKEGGIEKITSPIEKKNRKKKRKVEDGGIENPVFEDRSQISEENCGKKKKNKKKILENGLDNPVFEENSLVEEGKEPSKNKIDISNEGSMLSSDLSTEDLSNKYEIKRRDITSENVKSVDDTLMNKTEETKENSTEDQIEENYDLILNISGTPVAPIIRNKPKKRVGRRKSVRFSGVNEERVIPSREDLQVTELFRLNSQVIKQRVIEEYKKKGDGQVNTGFDLNTVQENISSIHRTIDRFHAEVENDMNEEKFRRIYGSSSEGNEKVGHYSRLSIKSAKFLDSNKRWSKDVQDSLFIGRKAYKHLLDRDVIVKFKGANLHDIGGY